MPTALRQQAYPFGSLRRDPHWSVQGLQFYSQFKPAGMLFDESLLGNHGTITGATWAGNGLNMSGDSQYFQSADMSDIFPAYRNYTIVLWAKRNDLTFGGVLSMREAATRQQLFIYDDGDFAFGDSVASWTRNNTNTWTDTSAFHQIVLQSTSPTVVNLYFDGVFITTWSNTQQFPFTAVYFGLYRLNSLSNTFSGVIKDASIYNRALSVSEIAALYINRDLPMRQPPIWLFTPPVVEAVLGWWGQRWW